MSISTIRSNLGNYKIDLIIPTGFGVVKLNLATMVFKVEDYEAYCLKYTRSGDKSLFCFVVILYYIHDFT